MFGFGKHSKLYIRNQMNTVASITSAVAAATAAAPLFYNGIPKLGTRYVVDTISRDLNIWVHYAVVWNGTLQTLYVNGAQVASATTPAYGGDTDPLFVGTYNTGAGFFSGYLDDAIQYNRALTSADILAVYNVIKN